MEEGQENCGRLAYKLRSTIPSHGMHRFIVLTFHRQSTLTAPVTTCTAELVATKLRSHSYAILQRYADGKRNKTYISESNSSG